LLDTPIDRRRGTATALALLAILVLAAFLRLWDLDRAGLGSFFYASAVRSMGESWHNFIYAAYDPAGTLIVDKPPLALWLQVLSTKLFGFEGWAIILPMALAGIAAVALVFGGARRSHGVAAALVAALVLAVFPESVATARDSTMDALILALTAAAGWLLVVAVEGRRPWLLIAWTALMGIAFNVKFFEGFILLPAATLYVGWTFRDRWRSLIAPVAVATLVGFTVSLSWVTFVELTPEDDRPMVMNDESNSEYGLVFRYNGLERVLPAEVTIFEPVAGIPRTQALIEAGQNYGVGDRGPLRLFQRSNDALIGFGVAIALASLVVIAIRRRDWLLNGPGLFWGGWLLTGAVFFSASNRAAAHYTEAYAPAIAVLAGVGIVEGWRARDRWSGFLLPTMVALLVTLAWFWYRDLPPLKTQVEVASAVAAAGALLVAALARGEQHAIDGGATQDLANSGRVIAVAALLTIPLLTSVWITFDAPRGGQVTRPNPIDFAVAEAQPPPDRTVPVEAMLRRIDDTMPDAKYRFAISSINDAGEAIAVSGASVLPIWNEYQRVPILDLDELEQLILDGQVPFVMFEGATTYTRLLRDLEVLVSDHCTSARVEGIGRAWSIWNCDPAMNPRTGQ